MLVAIPHQFNGDIVILARRWENLTWLMGMW